MCYLTTLPDRGRWLRRLDARERPLCILDSDEQGCIIVKRMRSVIERMTPSGGTPPVFALTIDITKVPQLAEASQGYHAIIGLEFRTTSLILLGSQRRKSSSS